MILRQNGEFVKQSLVENDRYYTTVGRENPQPEVELAESTRIIRPVKAQVNVLAKNKLRKADINKP
jgi:hypothetical protein